MRCIEFKTAIQQHLRLNPGGVTWNELRDRLALPYPRPCPEWTRRLAHDIGLVRRKGPSRSLLWSLQSMDG